MTQKRHLRRHILAIGLFAPVLSSLSGRLLAQGSNFQTEESQRIYNAVSSTESNWIEWANEGNQQVGEALISQLKQILVVIDDLTNQLQSEE